MSYTKICKIEQVRHGKGFIIEGQNQRSESLVNALKQAWEWNDWIVEGKYKPISWTTHTSIKVLPSNWEEQNRELNL